MNLIEGRYVALIMTLFIWGAMILFIDRAKKGNLPGIRRLAAVAALDEAVGRASEMGGTVMHVNGLGSLASGYSAQEVLAGLATLGHIAKKCATIGVDVIAPFNNPVTLTAAEEIVRSAYITQGKLENHKVENIRYIGGSQWSLMTATMGIVAREKAVSVTLIGAFSGEALAIVASGAEAGCFMVGGCARNTTQMPWFVSLCDFALIGEEVYALGAYLSEEPMQLGTLIGQDTGKILSVFLIVAGVILSLFNSQHLYNLLGL